MALQADPERLLSVLEYVRYRPLPGVQSLAVGIALLCAARMPGLPDLLMQADSHGEQLCRSSRGQMHRGQSD